MIRTLATTAPRYLLAIGVAGLAATPWILAGKQIEPSPYLLFLAAIIFASWLGGIGPGLLTAALGIAAALAVHAPSLSATHDSLMRFGLQLALYTLASVSIAYLSDVVRRARDDPAALSEELRQRFDLTEALTRNLGEGVFAIDRRGRVIVVNPAAEQMLGWPAAELIGRQFADILPPETTVERSTDHSPPSPLRALRAGVTVRVETDRYRRRDGSIFAVDSVSSPIRRDGRVTGVVVAFRDVSERLALEERLKHQALHDALTGLPNRALFDDRLRQAIHTTNRERASFALLLMDLDRFKEINDTFGHRYGDLVLQELAIRLQTVLRESDTVARLGGDEFGMILPATDEQGAALVTDKLFAILREPFDIDGQSLDIEGSIGITLYPDHGEEATVLLSRADVAMYVAKRAHEGHAFYTAEDDQYSPTKLILVGELRQAIERNELVLHYQPKVNVRTGRQDGVEALVRWQHPRRGLLTPDRFVPMAEHTGLIKPLNLWVLNEALRQCREWHDAGLEMHVAANLSARNLHDPQLPETIGKLLQKWRVRPEWFSLEITESAVMADPRRAIEVLQRLRDMHVCIVIDDFGVGYSSLSYLARLPADELKIDKSFVLDMNDNSDGRFIARSVIDLGHNLGLRVVAEGVENKESWDLLAGLGCDVAQGYYIGRPASAAEVARPLAHA
jgi:diguanylate cyclase (GGDEF)-like protein/PAS domain S-box-containing protein